MIVSPGVRSVPSSGLPSAVGDADDEAERGLGDGLRQHGESPALLRPDEMPRWSSRERRDGVRRRCSATRSCTTNCRSSCTTGTARPHPRRPSRSCPARSRRRRSPDRLRAAAMRSRARASRWPARQAVRRERVRRSRPPPARRCSPDRSAPRPPSTSRRSTCPRRPAAAPGALAVGGGRAHRLAGSHVGRVAVGIIRDEHRHLGVRVGAARERRDGGRHRTRRTRAGRPRGRRRWGGRSAGSGRGSP